MAGLAGILALGTLLSRVTGLGRTLVAGWVLGAGPVSDAYNLANTTPNIIYDLILGGVLSGTLVPVFVQALRSEDEREGERAVSAVVTLIVGVLLVASVLFAAATPLIIRFYTVRSHASTTVDERRLAVSLLYLFVPQLLLYGMAAVATALLQAKRRYAAAMYTPILNNVIVIGILLAAGATVRQLTPAAVRGDHRAVLLLGLGTTAGVAAMALALLPFLSKAGVRLRPVWDPGNAAVRTIVRLSSWTVGFVVANQVALLVVVLLSGRHPSDYTAYTYAYMFMILPHGIWTVSIMGPMESELAHSWQDGNREGYRRRLVESIWLVVVLLVPAALGLAALSHPAIQILLRHGNFSLAGARATGDALTAMALGLPGFSLFLLLMRAYQAMQDTRTMFLIYLVENAINIAVDVALYPHLGLRGLAIGLSAGYAGGAVVAFAHLARRIEGIQGRQLVGAAGLVTVGGLLAGGAAWLCSSAIGHLPGSGREVVLAARVLAGLGAGVTVYLLAARALGFDEIRRLLQPRRLST